MGDETGLREPRTRAGRELLRSFQEPDEPFTNVVVHLGVISIEDEAAVSAAKRAARLQTALAANPAPAGPMDCPCSGHLPDLHSDGDVCTGTTCGNPEHGWVAANPAPAGPLDCPCSGCFPAKLDVEQIADLFMDLRLDGPAQKGWTYQQTASWYANIIAARLERKG